VPGGSLGSPFVKHQGGSSVSFKIISNVGNSVIRYARGPSNRTKRVYVIRFLFSLLQGGPSVAPHAPKFMRHLLRTLPLNQR
jgi:hypothetical protein